MFEHRSLNPHYFANPPAFTYVLHLLLAIYYGGASGVVHAFAHHPTDVYMLARVASALLGVAALWLLYPTGARLFGRGLGLLAAADRGGRVPARLLRAPRAQRCADACAGDTVAARLAPGVLRKGRARDYLLAGIGLGLACATKYTGRDRRAARSRRRWRSAIWTGSRAPGGARWAASRSPPARASLSFLIANPYALLDYYAFHAELVHQSTLSAESQGKLGAPKRGGILYYLWSLTWGLGWVPALAALGGAVSVLALTAAGWAGCSCPTPLLFLAFMGLAGALLRPLAAADLPDPVPAGGDLRAAARRRGRPSDEAARPRAGVRAQCRLPCSRWPPCCCSPRAPLQRPLRSRALARRHPHSDAGVDGRPHPGRRTSIVVEPVAPDDWATALAQVLLAGCP